MLNDISPLQMVNGPSSILPEKLCKTTYQTFKMEPHKWKHNHMSYIETLANCVLNYKLTNGTSESSDGGKL